MKLIVRVLITILASVAFLYVSNWNSLKDVSVFDERSMDTPRIWRLFFNQPRPSNSREVDRFVCRELTARCPNDYDLVTCPNGSSGKNLYRLSKCIARRKSPVVDIEVLDEIRRSLLENSTIGMAAIVYACRLNPYLMSTVERYTERGVTFVTVCPAGAAVASAVGAAELRSPGGASFVIPNRNEPQDAVEVARQIRSALGLVFHRHIFDVCLYCLIWLPSLTFCIVSFEKESWKKWTTALAAFVFATLGPVSNWIAASIDVETRRRLIWSIPFHTLNRLVGSTTSKDNSVFHPASEFIVFYFYPLIIGKLSFSAISYFRRVRSERLVVDVVVNGIMQWYMQRLLEAEQEEHERAIAADQARQEIQHGVRVLQANAGECRVCRDTLNVGQRSIRLRCGQATDELILHAECIMHWISENRADCPFCRQPFTGGGHGF